MTKTYVIEMRLTVDAADADQAVSRAQYAVDYLCRDRGHIDYVRGAEISSARELRIHATGKVEVL